MKKTQSNRLYRILLICAAIIPLGARAQSAFDLTTVEPDVVPAGVTLEWHSALPVNASNMVATPETAAPGIYYAVFNYGSNCYSTPSPIRIGKNSCPSPAINLTQFADDETVPAGMEVTYHTAAPASDANEYTGDPAAAAPGKYYVAYHDQTNGCYSGTTPVVVLDYAVEPAPMALADSSLNNVLLSPVSVTILTNDTLSNGSSATPVPSTIALTTTNLPAGSTLNGDGTVTAAGQGTWSYNSTTGNLTFQPLPSYNRNPTPLTYTLTDGSTCKSTEAIVKITYAGALPVVLISFEGKAVENDVQLNWATASEINASHFEIQRSANAKDFTAIANVQANNAKSAYDFIDQQPLAGVNYYRLRMVDLDSTFAFSRIIDVRLANAGSVFVYPNPVSKVLKISSVSGLGTLKVSKVVLYDQNGTVRYATSKIKDYSVELGDIADGLYLVSVVCEDGTTYNSRIVVKK